MLAHESIYNHPEQIGDKLEIDNSRIGTFPHSYLNESYGDHHEQSDVTEYGCD